MTTISASIASIKLLLDEMRLQDFGYPIEENVVRPAPPARLRKLLPARLAALYEECDGMSLPDVHNGIFIDTAERVLAAPSRGGPVSVDERVDPIVAFGSDGGGNRYTMSEAEGSVWFLPSVGSLSNGHYLSHRHSPARVVAEDPKRFVQRIEADVVAFVRSTRGHRFIDAR